MKLFPDYDVKVLTTKLYFWFSLFFVVAFVFFAFLVKFFSGVVQLDSQAEQRFNSPIPLQFDSSSCIVTEDFEIPPYLYFMFILFFLFFLFVLEYYLTSYFKLWRDKK